MKIVMNEAGKVIARHVEAANINRREHYPADTYGPVLIGNVPDDQLSQDIRGKIVLSGSPIDAARDIAKQTVRRHVERETAEFTADYPQAERETWGAKLAEAKALSAGTDIGETVYLSAVAKATGKTVDQVAKSVIEKAGAFAAAMAEFEGFRTERYAAIDKAKNLKAIVAAVSDIE